jgi:hypothetical protein
MSAAAIIPFPELPIPSLPFCKTPPTFHTHLGRRLKSKTAYLIVGHVIWKTHEASMASTDADGRVWVSSYELQQVTGSRERMVEVGIEEAGSVHALEVAVDPRRGSGWWLRALVANFAAGTPNPPRKPPRRKPRIARMDAPLGVAALGAQPIASDLRQPIAAGNSENLAQYIAPDDPQTAAQPITADALQTPAQPIAPDSSSQPIAPGHPYNRGTAGEQAQPIALGTVLRGAVPGTGLGESAQSIDRSPTSQCTGNPSCPYYFRVDQKDEELASFAHPDSSDEADELMQRISKMQESGIGRRLGAPNRRTAENLLRAARQSMPGPAEVATFIGKRAEDWVNAEKPWGLAVTAVREDLGKWLYRTGWPAHEGPLWKRPPSAVAPVPAAPAALAFDDGDHQPECWDIWGKVKQELSRSLTPQAYENWVMRTEGHAWDDSILIVLVPDKVTKDFLEQEYAEQIAAALESTAAACDQIAFRIRRQSHREPLN